MWPIAAPGAASQAVAGARQGEAGQATRSSGAASAFVIGVAVLALLALGALAPSSFVSHLTVFVLAVFVGYQVIWNVTPALHTPLMSVTNAISGIIVIGALLQLGTGNSLVTVLGGIALFVATINIAGGFLVTQRMLKMFQRNS